MFVGGLLVVIPLTVIVGDVRVGNFACVRKQTSRRSLRGTAGRTIVMRLAVGLSASNFTRDAKKNHFFRCPCFLGCLLFLPSCLNMVVFAFAFGLSLPFALVQVIDSHVVIMNLMPSRVPLGLGKVALNESTPDTSVCASGTKTELRLYL